MSQLKELIKDIRDVETKENVKTVEKKYWREFENTLETVNDDQWQEVQELIIACVECGNEGILKFAATTFTKRKLIQWKKHPEIFDKFFDSLIQRGQKPASEKPGFWRSSDYRDTLDKIIVLLKALQMFKQYLERNYELITHGLSNTENRLICCIAVSSTFVPWLNHVDRIRSVMERTYEVVQEYPEMSYREDLGYAIVALWIRIFRSLMGDGAANNRAAIAIVDVITKVFNYCAEGEWIDPDDPEKNTVNHHLCKTIMEGYLQQHRDEHEIIKPMFGTVLKLRKSEDEIMSRDANNIVRLLGGNIAELMKDRMGDFIDEFVEKPSIRNIAQIREAFKANPAPFEKRVNEAANAIFDSLENNVVGNGLNFIWEMAKIYPQEFSKEVIGRIVNSLLIEETKGVGLMSLQTLAAARQVDVLPHDDVIITCMRKNPNLLFMGAEVLCHLAGLGKKYAAKYMRTLVDISKTSDGTHYSYCIYKLGTIGANYREEMAEHKAYLEEMLNNPALKQQAQYALDMIAGRSLQSVSQDVTEQKEEMKQIDERVTETEERVDEVEKDVKRIDENVDELKTDVAEQAEKLQELEVVVDETVEKVEEIDKKTLSHAPVWSHDVAKLMNTEEEHDWRFLATRLGYSNDDVRNWATQADPCLSLLDEWFATHKTREATFAIEQALNEMNRTDAAMIVENALKQAEGVVEEDGTEEWDPPPIFISYQWAHQPEVKLLHKHLEMAGYKSWMDIGQMGGGDKLFAKLDQGIRAAKVVICCVTEKYAKSANCNREVNLAVTLGKPMIPLLMEKLAWPPPGSMGPIFSEYIFVRFFARPGETAGDGRFWPTAKFQELLMQLRYTHAPDASIITSELYKDWWSPPEEIIQIQPKEQKSTASQNQNNEKECEVESPEVFISYQWGKQPQIKKLYQILTSMGYVCWLDIMQMGGGDSLYEKIDKGVRGCKVVLSCVTSKYSLSANCRREVSLADALKKPIVPLLLEKITWPPEGPMGMIFTQLLYIDFCKPDVEVQNSWNCPQMDELIGKLMNYVPRMKPIEQDTLSDDSAEKGEGQGSTHQNTEENIPPSAEQQPSIDPADKAEGQRSTNQNTEENIPPSAEQQPSDDTADKGEGQRSTNQNTEENIPPSAEQQQSDDPADKGEGQDSTNQSPEEGNRDAANGQSRKSDPNSWKDPVTSINSMTNPETQTAHKENSGHKQGKNTKETAKKTSSTCSLL